MNTLHRIIGAVNLFFVALTFFIVPMAASLLGGQILVPFFLLLYLVCTIWGIRNAIHYWGGPPKLTVLDHILLAAGVLNGFALLSAVALFIYIGEN